eukprot:3043130-Prymnesium_polylepis.1
MHPPEPPGHTADHPRPTQPIPYPTRRCEERERALLAAPTTCTLLVVVEAAGPVAGGIGEVVRLRCAVEE